MRHVACAVSVVFILAAPVAAHEERLAGGEWVLADAAMGSRQPVIRFAAGRISGSGGCNRFGGPYDMKGDAIRLFPRSLTRMACPSQIMAAERAFLKMLGRARTVSGEGDHVELRDGAGGVLAALTRRIAE